MNPPKFVRGGRYFYNNRIQDGSGNEWTLRERTISRPRARAVSEDPRLIVCLADCDAKLQWAEDAKASWNFLEDKTLFGDEENPSPQGKYEVSEWMGSAGPLLLFEELIG